MRRFPTSRLFDLISHFAPELARVRTAAVGVAVLEVGSPLMGAVLLWIVKVVIDEVLVSGRADAFPLLAAAYVGGALTKSGLDYMRVRLDASVFERLTQNVRAGLYGHLLKLSPGSLRSDRVGDLLTRLSGDAPRVARLIYAEPLSLLGDLAGALLYGTFLFLLSWKLTLIALVAVPPIAVATRRYAPRIRRAARVARHQASAWLSLAEESLAAIPLIHAFGARAYETERLVRRIDVARRAELRTVTIQVWLGLLIEVAAMAGGLLVLAIGAYEVQHGGMTLGAVVAFVGSVGSLYGPIRGLGKAPGRFHHAAAGAQRVESLQRTESAVQERPGARSLADARGRIEFRGVSFAYPGGPPVLRQVSLLIDPGEVVAMVGPNGSGKSTIVRLLLRLYDPHRGVVLLDGADLRDLTLDSLRRAVAVVLQDPYIVQGTIAENIRYSRPDAPDDAIVAAARLAGADRFIDTFRGGYLTQVGSRGERLSGGQRQRVALARALMRRAPVLILDEATAAVDGEAERLIQESLDHLAGRHTIVVIAHRLSTVRRVHRVLVLDGGRIAESGSPDELLQRGTRCYELFAGQIAAARMRAEGLVPAGG